MTDLVYAALEVVLLACALRSRRWAMMVVAFSLPLSNRLPSPPIPLLNYQNVVILTVLLSYVIHPEEKDAPRARVRHWVPISILALFLTVSFLNTVFTFTPDQFVRLWDPYLNAMNFRTLLLCFVLYALACLVVLTREDLVAVVTAGVAGTLLESAYMAFEFLVLSPGRSTGHFNEPNRAGGYLACALVFLLGLALKLPREPRNRWWAVAGGVLTAAVALLGTLSRGAWVSACAGFMVISALLNRKILAAGLVVLALSPLWIPEKVRHRMDETLIPEELDHWRYREGKGEEESSFIALVNESLEEEGGEEDAETRLDPSLQSRLIIWSASFQMIRDYPLGVGYGVFPWYLHYYSELLRFKAPHNTYIRIATEAGVPTLAVFLYLLAVFGMDALRVGRRGPDLEIRALGYAMFGYLVTRAVDIVSVDVFFQIDANGQFWILMGALMRAADGLEAPRPVPAAAPEATAAARPEDRPLYELVR